MHTTLLRRTWGAYLFLDLGESNAVATDHELSGRATAELIERGIDFLPFPDLEQAVRDDVKFLQGSKLVPDSVTISGWVYEVETGKTRRVV